LELLSSHRIPSIADLQAYAGFCNKVTAIPLPLSGVLSVAEVARYLGVSRPTVYAYCKRGELASARVAGAVKIGSSSLRDFVARRD
jgi:excisionase family DNA binding protein